MVLKQSAIAFCSCSNLFPTSGFPLPAASPFGLRGTRRKTSPPLACCSPAGDVSSRPRRYATVLHGRDSNVGKDGSPPWWPSSTNPTPYEILDLPKDAPYNKAKFYDLVKLYHPDHSHRLSQHRGISHLTRLERYHLVVTANNILSDPTKRRLYDSYGAGWGGQPDLQDSYRAADRTWRNEPGNASMNATWEDWENWYRERDGRKQEPVFMSNGGFVGLILLFVVIGSWGQATRAGTNSMQLMDMRDQKHGAISKAMNKRQADAAGLSRHDRVESFLKQREGWEVDQHSGHGHLWHDTKSN